MCYQNIWKTRLWAREGPARVPKLTTSSVKRSGGNGIAQACMAANKTGCLVFGDYQTAVKSSKINSEFYMGILSVQNQSNLPKLILKLSTVYEDSGSKHIMDITDDHSRQRSGMFTTQMLIRMQIISISEG